MRILLILVAGTGLLAQPSAAPNVIAAAERARRDAAAIAPGRTWTWRMRHEQCRSRVHKLQSDLAEMKAREAEFEDTLSSSQKSKLRLLLGSIQRLSAHLESDAHSLDKELSKGSPTRWHVARDALDMQRELGRWIRLHNRLAKLSAPHGL